MIAKAKELLQDTTIVWDSKRLKQIDEVKPVIMANKRAGYVILLKNGNPMTKWNPNDEEVKVMAKKEYGHIMKILSEKGDERVTWDKLDGRQAKEAKNRFAKLLKDGYKAFSVDPGGNKNRRIKEFDVDAEEILMIPPTAKG